MPKLDLKTIPKLKNNPIFGGMDEKLKDPKVFDEVEGKLKILSISDHKHSSVKSYVGCKRCKAKFDKRKELMKELGFKDIRQYMEWKRIHLIIKQKRNIQLQ